MTLMMLMMLMISPTQQLGTGSLCGSVCMSKTNDTLVVCCCWFCGFRVAGWGVIMTSNLK
jgi:hypothetical protein